MKRLKTFMALTVLSLSARAQISPSDSVAYTVDMSELTIQIPYGQQKRIP